MKRSVVILLVCVLLISFVSAGWWSDFWSGIFGDGGITGNAVTGCSDTDLGISPSTPGIVTYYYNGAQTLEDECSGSTQVHEYYCIDKTQVSSTYITCPDGTSCISNVDGDYCAT